MICDTNSLWVKCSGRIFVVGDLNAPNLLSDRIPYNDDCAKGAHMCYWGHGREDVTKKSCKLRGGHLVQPPANSDANISNPIYWRRCDGSLRNALDEPLSRGDGSDHTH